MPGEIDHIREVIPPQDVLRARLPKQDLAIGACSRKQRTIGRPVEGGDFSVMTTRERFLSVPVGGREDNDVPCGLRRCESRAVRMPDRSRSRLVFGLESSNHAIEFSHQLGLFRDNGIDVQNSVRAGDGDVPPTGVESDMFGSLGLLTEVFDLRDVFDVDNLDCQFTSCCQLPRTRCFVHGKDLTRWPPQSTRRLLKSRRLARAKRIARAACPSCQTPTHTARPCHPRRP